MARAEKRKYHYIYKITCKITNRFYIGMHSTDNLDDGYFGSGKRLWRSINYHGKENHIKEILEFLPSRQALKEREKEIVNKELIGEDLCMNLQEGGGGGFSSEEHRKKAQDSGRKTIFERIKKYPEIRKKYRERGLKSLNDYMLLGTHNFNTFEGKQHTDETKQKMSNAHKGKGIGETNSQYGTCWITKDGVNKKIKKEDFETYINDGWIKGRK